jgi:hypothetical protein
MFGPTYVYEYNTRATYGSNITWGQDDPLNATWWHLVTERASPPAPFFSLHALALIPFSAYRDAIESEPRCGARNSRVSGFSIVDLAKCFAVRRRSMTSRLNNLFARALALGIVSRKQYVICAAARLASPSRIARVVNRAS